MDTGVSIGLQAPLVCTLLKGLTERPYCSDVKKWGKMPLKESQEGVTSVGLKHSGVLFLHRLSFSVSLD